MLLSFSKGSHVANWIVNCPGNFRWKMDEDELISNFPFPPSQRSAALKLDWTKVTSSLGLRGQTVAGLQAFKQRNENARRKLQALSELPTTVDFAHYRSVLKTRPSSTRSRSVSTPSSPPSTTSLASSRPSRLSRSRLSRMPRVPRRRSIWNSRTSRLPWRTSRPLAPSRNLLLMRLLRLSPRSMRRRLSWCPRAAGPFRDTRYGYPSCCLQDIYIFMVWW